MLLCALSGEDRFCAPPADRSSDLVVQPEGRKHAVNHGIVVVLVMVVGNGGKKGG